MVNIGTREFNVAVENAHDALSGVWDAMDGMRVTDIIKGLRYLTAHAQDMTDDLQSEKDAYTAKLAKPVRVIKQK